MSEKLKILSYLTKKHPYARHAILIDPADQTPDVAAKRCLAAVNAGSSMILIGGSSDTDTTGCAIEVSRMKKNTSGMAMLLIDIGMMCIS